MEVVDRVDSETTMVTDNEKEVVQYSKPVPIRNRRSLEKLNGFKKHESANRTPEELQDEKKFLWKVDFVILPMLSMMFFLASMDRSDIGNASTLGLSKELRLSSADIAQCTALFYAGYIVMLIPGVLAIGRVTANILLGLALVLWGTTTTLLCLINSKAQLGAMRALVGVFEAFLQAGPLYLTFWYRRNELATRGAIFLSMQSIAGSMNGVISYGIDLNLNGVRGWLAWRWLFLIEGLMSVGFGVVVFLLLPRRPDVQHWLFSAKERMIAQRRNAEAFNAERPTIRPRQLIKVVRDPKCWFYTLMFCCTNVSLAAFGNFLPIMIRSFGYSVLDTQLLTIPVWVCTAVFIITLSTISDRQQRRGPFIMTAFAIAAVGWILFLASNSTGMSLVSVFLIGSGTLPTIVLIQAWLSNNVLGFTKRAGALGLILVIGNAFALFGAAMFNDSPRYYKGGGIALGAMVLGIIFTATQMWWLAHRNAIKKRDQYTPEAQAARAMGVEEINDDHPDYFYFL